MSDTSGWGPQGGPQTPHGGPPGPYGGPPPGWGWYGGWAPPPPPPKPGVIPLAPLGVDHVIGGAFATMRRYAKPLFGGAFAAYGVIAAVTAGAAALAYAVTREHIQAVYAPGATFSWDHVRPILIAFGAVWLVAMLATLAVNSFIQAACAATLHEAVLGRPATFGAVWRRAWSRTPPVMAVTLLLAFILLLPTAVCALLFVSLFIALLTGWVVPLGLLFLLLVVVTALAAWLYVLFAFAPAATVLESAGPLQALRRSVRLVRGAWWRTFGISLLAGLIIVGVSLAVRLPLQFATPNPPTVDPGSSTSTVLLDQLRSQFGLYAVLGLVGTFLTQLVASVFLPLVTALLYIDRRIRKEGLAHTLTEAASAEEPAS
ncbi:hypothetical protein [Streptomyces sp. MZ04]|uniref:DUF7847 domain-containing protein n=1 Tax=Streptomyces sp. MZ04 TaxID=2559236 RepID=UPI00107E681E|nr:hypothetical protein [Streptomyces sp. MZ04]TGB15238.1 hypothetical protein E2651_03215 [Streptomyces sp. MZ04]